MENFESYPGNHESSPESTSQIDESTPELTDQDQESTENLELENESPTLQHFWRAFDTGEIKDLSKEEIEAIVDRQLAKYPPMLELTDAERQKIREEFIELTEGRVNDKVMQLLIRDPWYYLDMDSMGIPQDVLKEISLYGGPASNHPQALVHSPSCVQHSRLWREYVQSHNLQPMSLLELKNKLRDNPDIAQNIRARIGNYDAHMSGWGIRELEGEAQQSYKSFLQVIKDRTGKNILNVLDFGGASGRFFQGLKAVDSNIVAYNLSIDELPVAYKEVDVNYVLPGEWTPEEIKEKMDYIHSNIAIRYFLYPDLGLRSVVCALSPGGTASLDFSTERSGLQKTEEGQEELKNRLVKVMDWLKDLESQGIISTNLSPEDYAEWQANPESMVHWNLQITKRKSMYGDPELAEVEANVKTYEENEAKKTKLEQDIAYGALETGVKKINGMINSESVRNFSLWANDIGQEFDKILETSDSAEKEKAFQEWAAKAEKGTQPGYEDFQSILGALKQAVNMVSSCDKFAGNYSKSAQHMLGERLGSFSTTLTTFDMTKKKVGEISRLSMAQIQRITLSTVSQIKDRYLENYIASILFAHKTAIILQRVLDNKDQITLRGYINSDVFPYWESGSQSITAYQYEIKRISKESTPEEEKDIKFKEAEGLKDPIEIALDMAGKACGFSLQEEYTEW